MHRSGALFFSLGACLFCQPTGIASAAQLVPAKVPVQAVEPARPGPSDARELETFVDGLMAAHMKAHHIPGAVIAVVKDSELFFAKGYGYADLERRRKVEADRTLFRIASISKLFVWTAVMQLVEEGKLDLNGDVSRYLPTLKTSATFSEPITMVHLMTHTPGFEDRIVGLFSRSAKDLRPLEQVVATELPARIYPPGQLAAYSNYGVALAGYVVEKVSGAPWEQHVENRILQPLGMNRTTARQPIPKDLAPDLSAGYNYGDGGYRTAAFEFIPAAPAGCMSACATDMARFMIAHLQDGRWGDARILQEDTAREMHRRRFAEEPTLSGLTLGFIEMNRGNLRIIGHGGDTIVFHSLLALVPEHNFGLFVSYNSSGGTEARTALAEAILDRYFPQPELAPVKPSADFFARAPLYVGHYAPTRAPHTRIDKLANLMTVAVRVTPDGFLVTDSPFVGVRRWVESAPFEFREVDGRGRLFFRRDSSGRVTRFLTDLPILSFVRMPWRQTPGLHALVLGGVVLIFVTILIAWPVRALLRWRRQEAGLSAGCLQLAAACWGWLTALTGIGVVALTVSAMRDPFEIVFGLPSHLEKAMTLSWPFVFLAAGCVLFGLATWWSAPRQPRRTLGYSLLAIAAAALGWQLWYWNFLFRP